MPQFKENGVMVKGMTPHNHVFFIKNGNKEGSVMKCNFKSIKKQFKILI